MTAGSADDLPPSNTDAEAALLGAFLLAGTVPPDSGVEAKHFYLHRHRIVYEAMLSTGADPVLIGERLRGNGYLKAAGGQAAIDLLSAACPNAGRWREYARVVRELWELRQWLAAAHRIVECVHARDRAGLERAAEWINGRCSNVVSLEARRSA